MYSLGINNDIFVGRIVYSRINEPILHLSTRIMSCTQNGIMMIRLLNFIFTSVNRKTSHVEKTKMIYDWKIFKMLANVCLKRRGNYLLHEFWLNKKILVERTLKSSLEKLLKAKIQEIF